jgi:hypothetical protein
MVSVRLQQEEKEVEELIIQIIVSAVLLLYPTWRIFGKAGLSPALSLIVLIPGLGVLICALILALTKWQVQPTGGN